MSDKLEEVLLPVERGFVINSEDGKKSKCTHIDCYVGYTLGGRIPIIGHDCKRGYYMYVRPVCITDDGLVTFELFSGRSWLLVRSARKGARVKEALAKTLFETHVKAAVVHLFGEEGIDFSPLPDSPQKPLECLNAI